MGGGVIRVAASGYLDWRGRRYRCALGRSGVRTDKREGDGATPAGRFLLRQCFFRPDRVLLPTTELPLRALNEHDGWCDDPADAAYNQWIALPHGARHERLWRDDEVYDVIVVIGHNDGPVRADAGSAIFLHVARRDYQPTEGCVALARDDLLNILVNCDRATIIEIAP